MKKLMILTIMVILAFVFVQAKGFTLMVYIGADNNLSGAANGDIDEMENAYGSMTGNLDIVICVDGKESEGGYDDENGNFGDTRYYHLSGGGDGTDGIINETPAAGSPNTELNTSDPQTLVNFVDWAEQNYPAEEYGLIIWNHGAGWSKDGTPDKGGLSDDTDNDFMSGAAGEWRTAIEGARAQIGQDFFFIGHDLCVMSYMEVIWDEYDLAEMIVSSEANEAFYGWYYDSFVTALATSNPTTHAELGAKIVEDYANYYTNISPAAGTMTYNVIGDNDSFNGLTTDEFLQLRDHIVWLAYYLIEEEGGRDDTDVQYCIDNAEAMSSGTLYEDFKDLYHFCELLTVQTKNSKAAFGANTVNEATAIMALVDTLNPEDWQNDWPNSHGLGIYLPDGTPYDGIEAPYDDPNHPWGGQDAVQWTDFIYGNTTTTVPTNYSTAISNAQASVSIDSRDVVFNYNFSGAYKRIEITRNSRTVFKDFQSGTYTDRINEPGIYEYTVTAFTEDNDSKELFSRTIHMKKEKPVIRKGRLFVDKFVRNIDLYGVDGRSINLPAAGNTMNLHTLSKGMYFIKADNDIFKLIVIDNEKMILN